MLQNRMIDERGHQQPKNSVKKKIINLFISNNTGSSSIASAGSSKVLSSINTKVNIVASASK
jgi:hypothetical protein